MLTMLKNWKGAVEIGGTLYESIGQAVETAGEFGDTWSIKLLPQTTKLKAEHGGARQEEVEDKQEYRITVKPYMTKPATLEFDFMEKWNNNKPMPMRIMVGTVEKETRGMQYMKLHGQGLQEIRCMRCGRKLENPVSRHYGIGPECMSKLGFVADIEEEDLIREKLQEIEWEGWIIKSAITEQEEI